jgi:hypothetical protein
LLYKQLNSNFFIQLSFFPAPEKAPDYRGTSQGLKLRAMDWLFFGMGLFVAGTFYVGAIRSGAKASGSLSQQDPSVSTEAPKP